MPLLAGVVECGAQVDDSHPVQDDADIPLVSDTSTNNTQHPENVSRMTDGCLPYIASNKNYPVSDRMCNDDLSSIQLLPSPSAVATELVIPDVLIHHQDTLSDISRVQQSTREGMTPSSNDLSDVQCVYKRGGWCSSHGRQARRGLKVTRKWELLKTGLYGHRTKKKVTWTCETSLFWGDGDFTPTARDDISCQQSGELSTSCTDNFTRAKLCQGIKREAGDYLEPRMGGKSARLEL